MTPAADEEQSEVVESEEADLVAAVLPQRPVQRAGDEDALAFDVRQVQRRRSLENKKRHSQFGFTTRSLTRVLGQRLLSLILSNEQTS